nr:DUF3152 domain-containing protein [Prescottella agglutinans]
MTDRGGPRLGGTVPEMSDDDPYDARNGGFDPGRVPDPHEPLRASWDPTRRNTGRPRVPRPDRGAKKQSRVGKFVSMYGWRAYAIPVLLIVTVLVLVDAFRGIGDTESAAPKDPGFGELSHSDGTDVIGVPPVADGNFANSIPSGVLPDGGPFTEKGAGTWHVVPGTTGQVGQGTDGVLTYTIEVEDGVDTAGFGGDESFGRMVDQTLANPKGWTKDPRFAFRRIDQGDPALANGGNPNFRISLTSQMTIREACGYDIQLEVSCYNPGIGRVVLNEPRWVRGAISYQGDIGSYRQYQINHEVGHAIGYQAHQPCESDGGLAPVMMQQTFGTANNDIAKLDPEGVVPMDGKVCRFNPWPYPRG